MIAVVDYGVGNLFSLRSSLRFIGAESCVTADAETLKQADKLILPGGEAAAERAGSGRNRGGETGKAPPGHLPGDAASL